MSTKRCAAMLLSVSCRLESAIDAFRTVMPQTTGRPAYLGLGGDNAARFLSLPLGPLVGRCRGQPCLGTCGMRDRCPRHPSLDNAKGVVQPLIETISDQRQSAGGVPNFNA